MPLIHLFRAGFNGADEIEAAQVDAVCEHVKVCSAISISLLRIDTLFINVQASLTSIILCKTLHI
jgi:hypothetical protein